MPASVVTRLNSITYGGLKIGEGTNYHLHGVHLITKDYTSLTVRALVMCADPTEATFVTQCIALEAAWNTPNANLKVEIGGSTYVDLTHSGNTGMLGAPSIRKAGSTADSNNTRLYVVSVTVQLPATEASKGGRQSSRAAYSSDGAEIVRLTISAIYTAITTNGALAQAKANFPAYVTTLQGVEGGTWDELDARTYQHDSDDKVCRATARYTQIIANQSSGTANDTTLQGVSITVRTRTVRPGDEPGSGAKRLQEVTVGFSCRVRKSKSLDLRNVWETKVRPRMIEIANDLSGTSRLTATVSVPGLSPMSNSIDAVMTFAGTQLSLINSDIVTATADRKPFNLEPVLTGKPHDMDRHTRPGRKFAVVLAEVLEVDTNSDRALGGYKAAIRVFLRQGYQLIQEDVLMDRRRVQDGMGITPPLKTRARRLQATLQLAKILKGAVVGASVVGPVR